MLFSDLTDNLCPFLLHEKYYKYTIPSKSSKKPAEASIDLPSGDIKQYLMYDFYMLTYLKSILPLPSINFRDLPTDLEDSVNDAVNTLLPYLREELLDAVFYAICAEMRHADRDKGNREIFDNDPKLKKL